MFGKKNDTATPLLLSQEKFDTLIGRHARIRGDLHLKESVRIDGSVIGNLESAGDASISVVIGAGGEVQGNVMAHRVVVAGKVLGNIHALERLELRAGGVVQGDVKYQSIAVEHGSRLQGLLLQMDEAGPQGQTDRDTREAIRRAQEPGLAR